jgi:hypothetical protein
MSDKIQEIIKEIASKHGVAVGRDDPIMILQTINERLLKDSADTQQKILNHYKEELEIIAHRWGDDAKDKAERTLNAALSASKAAMAKGLKEGTQATTDAIQHAVNDAVAQLSAPISQAKLLSIINLAAAGMTLIAAALVIGGIFYH